VELSVLLLLLLLQPSPEVPSQEEQEARRTSELVSVDLLRTPSALLLLPRSFRLPLAVLLPPLESLL